MTDEKNIIVIVAIVIVIFSAGAFSLFHASNSAFESGVQAGKAYVDSFPVQTISGRIVGIEQIKEPAMVNILFGTSVDVFRSLVLFDNATLTEDNQTTTIYQKMLSIDDYGLLQSYMNKTVTMTVKFKGSIPGYCVINCEGVEVKT